MADQKHNRIAAARVNHDKEARTRSAAKPYNLPESKIPIALVDSRPFACTAISEFIALHSSGFCVLSYSHFEQLVVASSDEQCLPELIIINVGSRKASEPSIQGAITEVTEQFIDIPLVLMTDTDDAASTSAAMQFGVRGVVPMTLNPVVAIAALCLVHAGGTFVPNSVMTLKKREESAVLPQHNGNWFSSRLEVFTHRQVEVLQHLRLGQPNKQIARELGVEVSTVKVHVRAIMKKLGANNRTHAALLAADILDDDSQDDNGFNH